MCAHAETKRNGVSYSSRGRPVLPQEFIFHTRIHRARGPVDQLEDRYLGMVEAVGSNPTRSTFPPVHTGLLHAIGTHKYARAPVCLMAATTIQLSHEMKKTLEGMKLHPRETYEDVLERLLEDLQELNEQTKKEIEQAVRDIKAGKYRTHQQLKDELGF